MKIFSINKPLMKNRHSVCNSKPRISRCQQPKAPLHHALQKLSQPQVAAPLTIIVSTSLIDNKKNSAMFSFKQVYLLPKESLLIIHKMIFPVFMLRPSGLTRPRVETSSFVNENQWKRRRKERQDTFSLKIESTAALINFFCWLWKQIW